mmetsp:Transcript_103127/g.330648  ORF Transcript_103127/g.330648 Transcript_103127/m.330648 type:complete len:189 (+) Transcript_103127:145-711(+)
MADMIAAASPPLQPPFATSGAAQSTWRPQQQLQQQLPQQGQPPAERLEFQQHMGQQLLQRQQLQQQLQQQEAQTSQHPSQLLLREFSDFAGVSHWDPAMGTAPRLGRLADATGPVGSADGVAAGVAVWPPQLLGADVSHEGATQVRRNAQAPPPWAVGGGSGGGVESRTLAPAAPLASRCWDVDARPL